ncbi:3'-5' exonuclease [Gilvibacter sediminis]|uniref:3'-5' exonuclease n=1 Tax=Gilvibacter sediminis TaxID=379071 RepID=UPI0023500569|nr:3'-5' exonuclease [Gilvibacter sediminis]MDC7996737.1 3'-5' exonuclease [Gilvibacter sediminis]
MLQKIPLNNILFLDIETVPEAADFNSLDEETKELYAAKTQYQRKEISAEEFYERAGIWAEFGKIICIAVGYFTAADGGEFRVTSFSGEETQLLREFNELLESHFNRPYHRLCAHNGKEFDFPYLARRMTILGIPLPNKLQLFGKKPWEVPHLDTMELWKFGDFKHYTSLRLLAKVLGIPSPKEDISGDQVREVYYEDNDLDRIVEYCQRDTITVAQIFLRYRNQAILQDHQIKYR